MNYPDTLTVEVTQEDIDQGYREDCQSCPIARALKRMGYDPYVEGSLALFVDEEMYVGSADVKDFIEGFDSGKKVEPTTFVLERAELDW